MTQPTKWGYPASRLQRFVYETPDPLILASRSQEPESTVNIMTDPFHGFTARRTRLAALIAACALGLTACGAVGTSSEDAAQGGQSAPTTTGADAAPETGTVTRGTLGTGYAATSADAGVTPVGNADTAMKTSRPEAPSQLMVTGVRVGHHEGLDRVVFDLAGEGEPGWFIDYTAAPAQQGSGNTISYQGEIALNVNIDGTTYPFELGKEEPNIGTVEGVGNVTQVISTGTFEGRSQFVIGLKAKLPYAVQVLHEPHRLVIDIPQ